MQHCSLLQQTLVLYYSRPRRAPVIREAVFFFYQPTCAIPIHVHHSPLLHQSHVHLCFLQLITCEILFSFLPITCAVLFSSPPATCSELFSLLHQPHLQNCSFFSTNHMCTLCSTISIVLFSTNHMSSSIILFSICHMSSIILFSISHMSSIILFYTNHTIQWCIIVDSFSLPMLSPFSTHINLSCNKSFKEFIPWWNSYLPQMLSALIFCVLNSLLFQVC